jgi:hypothetical protein
MTTIGATLNHKLSTDQDNDLACTALDGMLLFTDGRGVRKGGFKRAKVAITHAGVTGHPGRLGSLQLHGVATDTVVGAKLIKENPTSVGSISSMVGGAVTIMTSTTEMLDRARVGDRLMASSETQPQNYKPHENNFRSAIMQLNTGYLSANRGGVAALDATNNTADPTGVAFAATDVDHELVAATALTAHQDVHTTAGATVTHGSDFVVNDKVVALDAAAAAASFTAAVEGTTTTGIAPHVVAAIAPDLVERASTSLAAAGNDRKAASLVATAAAFGLATSTNEYLGLRKHFKAFEGDLEGALANKPASKAGAFLAAVAKALPAVSAPKVVDPKAASITNAIQSNGSGTSAGHKAVKAIMGTLVPHTLRQPLPPHKMAKLPAVAARNTAQAMYADRLNDPTARRLVMEQHVGAADHELLDHLKADLAKPDVVAKYILGHPAGLSTRKANIEALRATGMSNKDAKAALGTRVRTREELVRHNDRGHAFATAVANGHIDHELATATMTTASSFANQWTAPRTADWTTHTAADGTEFKTKFADNKAHIIVGAINPDVHCAENRLELSNGASIDSAWLGFVEQPGEYSFVDTGAQFAETIRIGVDPRTGVRGRVTANRRTAGGHWLEDGTLSNVGRIIGIDRKHGLFRVVLDIQAIRTPVAAQIPGMMNNLVAKYDDINYNNADINDTDGYHGRMHQYETADRPLNSATPLPRPLEPMNIAPQQPVYAQVCFDWDAHKAHSDGSKVLPAGTVLYGMRGTEAERKTAVDTYTAVAADVIRSESGHVLTKRIDHVNHHANVAPKAYTFATFVERAKPQNAATHLDNAPATAGDDLQRNVSNAIKRGWMVREFLGVVADTVVADKGVRHTNVTVQIAGAVSLRQTHTREYGLNTLFWFDNNRGARVLQTQQGHGPYVMLCTLPPPLTGDYMVAATDADSANAFNAVFAERPPFLQTDETHPDAQA